MENNKKYEAGKVEISSEEYRDLVAEAVEARRDAEQALRDKWAVESKVTSLTKELEAANEELRRLNSFIASIRSQEV